MIVGGAGGRLSEEYENHSALKSIPSKEGEVRMITPFLASQGCYERKGRGRGVGCKQVNTCERASGGAMTKEKTEVSGIG